MTIPLRSDIALSFVKPTVFRKPGGFCDVRANGRVRTMWSQSSNDSPERATKDLPSGSMLILSDGSGRHAFLAREK